MEHRKMASLFTNIGFDLLLETVPSNGRVFLIGDMRHVATINYVGNCVVFHGTDLSAKQQLAVMIYASKTQVQEGRWVRVMN
jgi:hypothetical protein